MTDDELFWTFIGVAVGALAFHIIDRICNRR